MSLLDADEIAAMRASAAEALDTFAVIQTSSEVSDGGGGFTTAWTAAGTVAARVGPVIHKGGDEGLQGDRLTSEAEAIVTLSAETVVDHNARILVDGKTYSVISVRERSQEMTRRIQCKVIE